MVVHKAPHECARRILLCVSGMTPQIVTETLQALLDQSPRFEPTAIRIVTTAQGKAKAEKQLIAEGHLAALCADYGLDAPPLDFTPIRDADGKELDDIRNGTDNTAAADCILAIVRELTQDAGCAIHASLAGGRKTMSHYMGYALSLFGRPQDRLSHVLVAPAWVEGAADFFYVPRQPVELHARKREGESIGCVLGRSDEVTITLADIPLLRLGEALPRMLRKGQVSFSETVRLANLALAEPQLVLDSKRCRISASGSLIDLPPLQFVLMYWFASRVQRGLPGFPASCIDDEVIEDFLQIVPEALPGLGSFHDSDAAENQRFYKAALKLRAQTLDERTAYFSQNRSKLNKNLENALGDTLANLYWVGRKNCPVGLNLQPEQIHIASLPDPDA